MTYEEAQQSGRTFSSMAEAMKAYEVHMAKQLAAVAARKLAREKNPKRIPLKSFRRPKVSYAMGVHPKQARNAEREAAARGVPTKYTDGGLPIITSVSHQKKLAKLYGLLPKRHYG